MKTINIDEVPNSVIIAIAKAMVEDRPYMFCRAGFAVGRVEAIAKLDLYEAVKVLGELLLNDKNTLIFHAKRFEDLDKELFIKRKRDEVYRNLKRVGREIDETALNAIEAKIKAEFSRKGRIEAIKALRKTFVAQVKYLMDTLSYKKSVKITCGVDNDVEEIKITNNSIVDVKAEEENSKKGFVVRKADVYSKDATKDQFKDIDKLVEDFKLKYFDTYSNALRVD